MYKTLNQKKLQGQTIAVDSKNTLFTAETSNGIQSNIYLFIESIGILPVKRGLKLARL